MQHGLSESWRWILTTLVEIGNISRWKNIRCNANANKFTSNCRSDRIKLNCNYKTDIDKLIINSSSVQNLHLNLKWWNLNKYNLGCITVVEIERATKPIRNKRRSCYGFQHATYIQPLAFARSTYKYWRNTSKLTIIMKTRFWQTKCKTNIRNANVVSKIISGKGKST